MPLTPGFRLAQYEILEPIGSGGMGEVYKARDSRLDRDVAIKVMAPHVAADPDMRRRFETEARAVAALSHSSIVAIHELAVVDDVPLAVMELLEGQTLRARLKSSPLPWREGVQIATAVAEGLAAAHARGIVHRDLKPENVFLTRDGAVKILDFGLALHRQVMPQNGTTIAFTAAHVVLGTFGYMSPEQVTGERVDARSDIFAFGCLLYEMVTGQPRFGSGPAQEVIARLLSDAKPDLTAIEATAPPELGAIIAKCTERQASKRFESASDVAMALRSLLSGTATSSQISVGRAKPRGRSLAVLPFVNSGADPETEYLTNGITESIINSLSQLSGLRVVPRSLVFRYKGLQADPLAIGLALNARTILTGRVTAQGDQLTIQAELVDTATESQLWGEQFRVKLADLANVQQEIAWQISEALRLKLTVAQKKKLKKRAKVDPEAYQEYLRGRHFFNSWTPQGFRKALEHFERAINHDPMFAPAYAGLGDTIGSMSYYGFIAPDDGYPRANAAAQKAIELDPNLGGAHGTLALGRLFFDWNWELAGQQFRKAIELDPQHATVRAFYAIYLTTTGQHEAAVAEGREARMLDPLSPLVNMIAAWTLYFAGRVDLAVEEMIKLRVLLPSEGREELDSVLIVSYELLGQFDDAIALSKGSRCFGVEIDADALQRAYDERGTEGYWQERLAAVDRAAPTALPMIHMGYASIYVQLGRFDDAVRHLEKLVEQRLGGPVFFAVHPAFTPLRGHPAFEALITRIGIPRHETAQS